MKGSKLARRIGLAAAVPVLQLALLDTRPFPAEELAPAGSLRDSYRGTALSRPPEALPRSLPSHPARVWPVEGRVTQEFGPTHFTFEPPLTYKGTAYLHFHSGLDIAAPLGSPVRAIDNGRVIYEGRIEDGALILAVEHSDGLVSIYGHLDDQPGAHLSKLGSRVKKGEVIGAVGLTGITTGPHLHLITYREDLIDPRKILLAPLSSR